MATVAPDNVEMATPMSTSTESALMATPASRTSSVGVKMVKKKNVNLNSSKRKLKSVPATPVNFSFHNMSIQKQTLRANNKALAQNLAKVKLEVRRLQKENTELESQNQETQHELRRLKRVVGIKDAEIEEEVQRRIQIHMLEMKKSIESVAEYMAKMSEGVTEIYQKCVVSSASSRQSSLSNRSSLNLLDYSSNSQRRSSVSRRSSFSSISQAEFLAKADELASNRLSDSVARRSLSDDVSMAPSIPDMSVIMEQSILTEETVACPLKSKLSTVSESANQNELNSLAGSGRNSKLPQRIPRQTSRENLKSDSDKEKTTQNVDVTESNKDSDKTIIDNATKPKSKKRGNSDKSGQNEVEKKKNCLSKDSSNDVTDLIETDIMRTRSNSKEDKSKPLSADLESEECNLLGEDFDNLVSGSPIMIESDKSSRRETFSLSKPPSLEGLEQINKEQNEKIEVSSENCKSKSSNSHKPRSRELKKDQPSSTESNASAVPKNKLKHLKTGGHVRRNTYVAENPFKPNTTLKRTPLATETNEKQSAETKEPKGSIENPFKPDTTLKRTPEAVEANEKQSSETEKAEESIKNPFKPNTTLKRTPEAVETNDKQSSETEKTKGNIENPFKPNNTLKRIVETTGTDKRNSTRKTEEKKQTKEKSQKLLKQQSKSKVHTAPKAAVVNRLQKPEEKVIVKYPQEVENPFKPTKSLLRSPPPQPKLDSRQFLAKLCNKLGTDEAAEEPPEGPSFIDEPTTYFNADMELTVPLSASDRRSPFVNSMEHVSESSRPVEKDQAKNGTDIDQTKNKNSHTATKKTNTEATDKRKYKTTEEKSDKLDKKNNENSEDQGKQQRESIAGENDKQKATVEMRIDKPGKFSFAASRKEADGSRKPVPEKLSSRARSKKKQMTPEKDPEPPNLGPDRDLFNFGDRTPTVPLNKILQEKEKASAVYDLSMNESVVGPPISLNNFRENNKLSNDLQEKNEKEKGTLGTTAPNQTEGNIYHLPLKGSPQEKPKKTRGRSKSGTRSKSKSRKSNDSDDDDYVPYKSRSKSKSRKADPDEECVQHKSRSKVNQSDDESNASPNSKPKPRTRGRSRTRKIRVETDEEAADETSKVKYNGSAPDEKSSEQEPPESPLVRKSVRSRARPVITSEDLDDVDLSNDDKVPETESENKVCKGNKTNSKVNVDDRKSRSKPVSNRNELLDNDTELIIRVGKKTESTENTSKDSNIADRNSRLNTNPVENENVKETDPSNIYYLPLKGSPAETKAKMRTRSKSRTRHVSESDDESISRRQMKGRSRSKSCTRQVSESEDEAGVARSRSGRSRSVRRENSELESEQLNVRKQYTKSRSRSRSIKTLENDKLASDHEDIEKNGAEIVKDKCSIAVLGKRDSDSDFQSETRHRRKSRRQTKLQRDLDTDIQSDKDTESKLTGKDQVLNSNKLLKADAIILSDSSPEPARFVTKSRGGSMKLSSEEKTDDSKGDVDRISEGNRQTKVEKVHSEKDQGTELDEQVNEADSDKLFRKSKQGKQNENENEHGESSKTGKCEEQLKLKTPNVMCAKPVKTKSVKKKTKETDMEKPAKVAKKQTDTRIAEQETPIARKGEEPTGAKTVRGEDSLNQAHMEQAEFASKKEKLPAKTPSLSKESKASTSSRSTKTKTVKSSRKKKDEIVTEDQTPKGKASRKSEKSSQKKIQSKENDGPLSRLESLKRRLTTMSSKSSLLCNENTEELTNQDRDSNVPDSEDGIDKKRARRTKNPVSYVSVPLNKKLRQGDTLFQSKSPITKDKAERARVVLGQHKTVLSEGSAGNDAADN